MNHSQWRISIPQVLYLQAILLMAFTRSMAADRIEIEVATETGLSPTAPQQWVQLLGKLDVSRIRLRSIRSGDVPKLTANETAHGFHYRLLAILDRQNRLLLPGAKFKRSDLQALRNYLKRLQEEGLENFGAVRGRFQLTAQQLQTVLDNLSQTVSHSTRGQSTSDILTQVASQLTMRLVIDAQAQTILARSQPVNVELQDMAAGTALALLLRGEGLAMTPERRRKQYQLNVAPSRANRQAWPVGWKSPSSPRRLQPKLYKRLTIEVDGYTLSEALEALQPRLGMPYYWDRLILAQKQIIPESIQVSLPREKTYLKRTVDRMLSQARLASEIRVDEKGHAFFWFTQFGKDSPRAERLNTE